jgi:DNA-binding FrmR family transcriptional regulator
MAHLATENAKLIARVKRLKGQLEGVERMLTEGEDCFAILQNTAACRGAFNALTKELILSHIEHHLVESDDASDGIRDTGKEIQSIVRSYLK